MSWKFFIIGMGLMLISLILAIFGYIEMSIKLFGVVTVSAFIEQHIRWKKIFKKYNE